MVSLHVKIKPGASRDEITIDEEGKWLIRIKERPIDGAANSYLVKFLSEKLNIRKSDIKIEKGLNSPFKKISINMDPLELETRIGKNQK